MNIAYNADCLAAMRRPAYMGGDGGAYHEYGTIQCSQCQIVYNGSIYPRNFCPNCGADMREEPNETNLV